jgi:hypothetical protein
MARMAIFVDPYDPDDPFPSRSSQNMVYAMFMR